MSSAPTITDTVRKNIPGIVLAAIVAAAAAVAIKYRKTIFKIGSY